MRPRVAMSLIALGVAVAACASAGPPSPSGPGASSSTSGNRPSGAASTGLTIYAAASLKAVLAKVKTAYEAANPGTTLAISTDSSAALETKIEQGAPADVFLSADTTNPQKLVDKGLAGSPTKFAGNVLTVIVPRANPAGIATAADLARPGIKIVGAGDNVPITRYANLLVANLATQPGFPDQFAARYALNIVSREDNVAAVVAKIELGEGDAAIVYQTDAQASTKVIALPVPAAANVPATYAGVVVKASGSAGSAGAFLTWLAGPDGQAILATFGFRPPS